MFTKIFLYQKLSEVGTDFIWFYISLDWVNALSKTLHTPIMVKTKLEFSNHKGKIITVLPVGLFLFLQRRWQAFF